MFRWIVKLLKSCSLTGRLHHWHHQLRCDHHYPFITSRGQQSGKPLRSLPLRVPWPLLRTPKSALTWWCSMCFSSIRPSASCSSQYSVRLGGHDTNPALRGATDRDTMLWLLRELQCTKSLLSEKEMKARKLPGGDPLS